MKTMNLKHKLRTITVPALVGVIVLLMASAGVAAAAPRTAVHGPSCSLTRLELGPNGLGKYNFVSGTKFGEATVVRCGNRLTVAVNMRQGLAPNDSYEVGILENLVSVPRIGGYLVTPLNHPLVSNRSGAGLTAGTVKVDFVSPNNPYQIIVIRPGVDYDANAVASPMAHQPKA
jgi:hypothetical protein